MENRSSIMPEIQAEEPTVRIPNHSSPKPGHQSPSDWNKDSRYSSFYFSFFETKGEMTSEIKIHESRSADNLNIKQKKIIKELDKINLELKRLNQTLTLSLKTIKEKNEQEKPQIQEQSKFLKGYKKSKIFKEDPKCICLDICHIY